MTPQKNLSEQGTGRAKTFWSSGSMQPQARDCETWLGLAWLVRNAWKYIKCSKITQKLAEKPQERPKCPQTFQNPPKMPQTLPKPLPKASLNPPHSLPKSIKNRKGTKQNTFKRKHWTKELWNSTEPNASQAFWDPAGPSNHLSND